MGDPPAQEDPLQGHLPNGSPANEEEFENGIATDSGDQPGEEPHLESVSNVPQNAEEEPILGDPPSREDSLLGHMPSANPAAQKEFDDAIATVSGNQQGGQQRLERVSEGPQHTELSQSRDGESAISNDARQAPGMPSTDSHPQLQQRAIVVVAPSLTLCMCTLCVPAPRCLQDWKGATPSCF